MGANALDAAFLLGSGFPSFAASLRPTDTLSHSSPSDVSSDDFRYFVPEPDTALQSLISGDPRVAEAIRINSGLPGILDPNEVLVRLPLRDSVDPAAVVTAEGYRPLIPKSPEARKATAEQIESWVRDGVLTAVSRDSVKCFNRLLVVKQKDKCHIKCLSTCVPELEVEATRHALASAQVARGQVARGFKTLLQSRDPACWRIR